MRIIVLLLVVFLSSRAESFSLHRSRVPAGGLLKQQFSQQRYSFTAAMSATVDKNTQAAAFEQIKQEIKRSALGKVQDPSMLAMMSSFLEEYTHSSMQAEDTPQQYQSNIMNFFKGIIDASTNPHQFNSYHKSIRAPFDYFQWGNDFFRTLIIKEQSRVLGLENAQKMLDAIAQGDNVVVLSNHQTEADPQVLSILLEESGLSHLAENTIFIAGHKVTTDPVAIPFSMGRNLLCIHSKKHINNPPELKSAKQQQNLRTTAAMGELFKAGGKIFWVAPSGGRDRPDESGDFVVAPFDFKNLDMFRLMAKQSGKPLHFFPMAMYSNELVPPPKDVSSSLGEERSAKRGAVSVNFLPPTNGVGDLRDREFCTDVQAAVEKAYKELSDWHKEKKSVSAL